MSDPDYDSAIGTSVTYAAFNGLASKYRINFMHVPTGNTTSFPAMLNTFSDKWNSSWDEGEYFGRMDKIARFKGTSREISIAFTCVADDGREAAEYMRRFQMLVKFLYPSYHAADDQGVVNPFQAKGVHTVGAAPVLGIQLCNLVQSPNGFGGGDWLYGYTDGFGMDPDQDMGWFLSDGFNNGVPQRSKWEYAKDPDIVRNYKIMLPKKFDIDFTFKVLHTTPLGWNADGSWMGGKKNDYPYNADDVAGTLPDLEPLMPRPTTPRWKSAHVKPAYIPKKGFLDWLEDVADDGL